MAIDAAINSSTSSSAQPSASTTTRQRQSSLDLATLAGETRDYHVWEQTGSLNYLIINDHWREEFENEHCSNCDFCRKHLHLSMYTRYKICEKWHSTFKRLSCMNSIVESARQMSEANPVNYDEVHSWGKGFSKLMSHPVGRQLFKEFLAQEHSDENILFWEAVEIYKQLTDSTELHEFAQDLANQFVSSSSKTEISLDAKCKADLLKNIKKPNKKSFDEAQEQVFKLMERDSYNRFTRSLIYRTFLQRQVPLEVVHSWGEKLDVLLHHHVGRHVFHEFLQLEKADENLRFWETVQKYKKLTPGTTGSTQLKQRSLEIWKEFLAPESKTEVSVDSQTRADIKKNMENPSLQLFSMAEQHVFQLMQRDPYNRFTRSPFFKQFIENHTKTLNALNNVAEVV